MVIKMTDISIRNLYKVYGDNPNFLPLTEKKTRWEIKKYHKFKSGIDETMSIDNCTHSFFGASKSYADLIVQEYGKNVGLMGKKR